MTTFTIVLERVGIDAPNPAIADIEVPVLTGLQRQGDVAVIPRAALGDAELAAYDQVPASGVPVVVGEATGNTHILMPDHGSTVFYRATPGRDGDVTLGVVHVPTGSTAWLIHTDEHGVNGIGAGTFRVHGKREQRDEIERVAD